jgi:hypothetical protein
VRGGQRCKAKIKKNLSALRSDCSHGSETEGWAMLPVAKDSEMRLGKQLQAVKGPT